VDLAMDLSKEEVKSKESRRKNKESKAAG
jgi:hypothetical protein